MILLALYIFIGLVMGFVVYCAVLAAIKKKPDDERLSTSRTFIEQHTGKYMIYSALLWPLYVKWFLSKR